jgi:hypothetical protein
MPKSTPPGPGLKRMNINLEAELHDAFKSATAAQGKKMTDVLLAFIEQYVRQHRPGGGPQKPSRK